MSVAEVRGFLAGIVGFVIGLGYAVTSWVGCGFYFTTLSATWRIPLLLGIAFPLLWIVLLPTIDETPRWLATQGRYDEVTEILRRIHANPQDPTHAYADYEAAQLQAQAEMDKTLDSSWKILFTTPGNRKRVACVVLAASGQMCSGVAAILAFGPTLYAGLGYDTGDQLFFSAGFNTISPLESILMMYLCDKIGRKVMIATCPLGSAVCLFIYSGLVAVYADSDNQAGKAAAVAMLFIYFAAYLFIEVAIFVFIGEVFPTRLRAKGSTIGIGTIALHSIWTTMATPVGLDAIGYKFIFVFGALSVLFGGLIIWLFPETKQVPLEEIARLFGEENEIGVVTSGAFKTRGYNHPEDSLAVPSEKTA